MDVDAFLSELDQNVSTALGRISAAAAAGEPSPDLKIPKLLAVALKNELEATEEAAIWLASESDIEVKLALARQCGDEAKHYRLIQDRLRVLGVELAKVEPRAGSPSRMFEYLRGLSTTVERVAAGQFTREALAKARNQVFIDFCEAQGDRETAKLYREVIQPDELHHHELGRKLLRRFAVDDESQRRAREASRRTLEIAEELQEIARLEKGISRAPGC